MKYVLFLLATVIGTFSSCTSKQEAQKKEEQVVVQQPQSIPHSATEELSKWFDSFHDNPVFSVMFDSIKAEYPRLMSDIRFLDSIRGLKIDFIGMTHSNYGMGGVSETQNARVVSCQSSIEDTIKKHHWSFIGVEISSKEGKISLESFLKEQALAGDKLVKVISGNEVHSSPEEARKVFSPFIKDDFTVRKLFTHDDVPYLIGTEPEWVWMTEQLTHQVNPSMLPQQTVAKLNEVALLLNASRSEIALSRTARHLMKLGKGKTAVLIYGKLHMEHFRALSQKFGTISTFIVPASCE